MPRRKKCRWVGIDILPEKGGEIELSADEIEAVRLVDVEGINQIDASERMGISQPTLHRILREARRKIGIATLEGNRVKITGGDHIMRRFKCYSCGNEWDEPFGTGKPNCPKCNSSDIGRMDTGRQCRGRGSGGRGKGSGKGSGRGSGSRRNE